MRYYDKITPDGTRDLLFSECDQRSQVTKTLKDLFDTQGYRRVMTPALEFYDVFGKLPSTCQKRPCINSRMPKADSWCCARTAQYLLPGLLPPD